MGSLDCRAIINWITRVASQQLEVPGLEWGRARKTGEERKPVLLTLEAAIANPFDVLTSVLI